MKILLLILLLIAGCTMLPVQKDLIPTPVRAGTTALDADFKSFPTQLYENSPFSFLVEVSNEGAEDIYNGVYVTSSEEEFVQLTGLKQGRFTLRGSKYGPGEKEIFNFKGQTKFLSPTRPTLSTTMRFQTCYDYKTLATANVCIDTDIFEEERNKVCRPGRTSMSGGQGGPAAVTSVETKILPHPTREDNVLPEFTIHVRNAGKGLLMAPGRAIMLCQGSQPYKEDIDSVTLSAMLSDQSLNCGKSFINLQDEKEIICTLDEGIPKSRGTYPTQLAITLSYGYVDTIAKSFTIKKRT